jgi:hypothetical protein
MFLLHTDKWHSSPFVELHVPANAGPLYQTPRVVSLFCDTRNFPSPWYIPTSLLHYSLLICFCNFLNHKYSLPISGCQSLRDYAPIVESDLFHYIPCICSAYPICSHVVYEDLNPTQIIFRGNTSKTWYSFWVSPNELLLDQLSMKA